MKILMLTPYLPYPLLSGGQIRSYNLLKNLSRKHDITLFSYIRDEKEREHTNELLKYCRAVHLVRRRRAWSAKNILLAGFTPYPFLVCLYLSRGLRRVLGQVLRQERFDLIHAETFYVMPQIPRTNIPILLVEQTIEWMVYERFVRDVKNSLLKPLLYFDVMKIKYWEKYYWRQANRLATVSEEDKKIVTEAAGRKPVGIVANGVDVDFFAKTSKRPYSAEKTVMFVGNFKWLPNSDAAIFLTTKIWPLIKKQIPKARLMIVGKNPTAPILALEKFPDVQIQSEVSDIRDAFAVADLMLAPIRNGRGTKYKVLEAVATRTPVVATPLAVEGLEMEDKKEVLLGTKAEELADRAIRILQNPVEGQKLAHRAYAIMQRQYNWERISRHLDAIYREMGKSK